MKRRIYKRYRTKKRGGQRYWVGSKINKSYSSSPKSQKDLYEEIRIRNIVELGRRKRNLDQQFLDSGISSDYISEIPDNIKTKLAVGVPLDEHEFRFIPREIRQKSFDKQAGHIQENIDDEAKYMDRLTEALAEHESERKQALLEKNFDKAEGIRLIMTDREQSIKHAQEYIKNAEERKKNLRKRFHLP